MLDLKDNAAKEINVLTVSPLFNFSSGNCEVKNKEKKGGGQGRITKTFFFFLIFEEKSGFFFPFLPLFSPNEVSFFPSNEHIKNF